MANTLRIKRRASGGAAGAPTTSQCVNAELAFNEVDGILYYGKGGTDTASSSVIAIGAELGTGVAAFLKTPSSANLATALTDETGSSTVVFSNSPTLVTPDIGTPSAGTLTNCTGLPISTGVSGLGTGVATFLATPNSANLYAALTDETGSATGSPLVMFNVNPTVTSSLKVSLGNILYSKLLYNGVAVYNYSDDTVAASFLYGNAGQFAPTSGWITKGNIAFSDSYGATTTTALKWQVASGSVGETAVWSTLSCAAVPATYAAHPVGESGYGKLSYNLKLPANSGELATTAYVASAIAAATGTSTSLKQAVAVATTANITLSGLQTIDGYTTVDGDRVLVKNQTTGSANGIYVAVAGSWTRALDADTAVELSGATVFVQNGTTNGSKTFTCTTSNITLGTTSLTFTDTTTVSVVAGDGLTQTGSILAVGSTGGGSLTVTSDSVNLTSGIATAGTYRSVTVDTYGRVTAGTTPTTFSGYGISDSADNLRSAITSTTGTGNLVFATNPTFTTPNIGVATGTSFNSITGLSSTTPVVNGTAAVGTATTAARADHVHPTDTSRAATAGTLAQFASTTSSQLAGVISDETGTGVLVFDTSPAFTTSVTTASTTFSVFNTNATTVNAFGAATALSVGASSGTTTINNNLTVTGNLTINGTTTTVNSTTVTIDDPIFTLGGDTAPASDDNKDRGIEFRWHNGTAAKVGFFGFDDSTGKMTFIPDATNTSEVFSGTLGTIDVGAVHINGTEVVSATGLLTSATAITIGAASSATTTVRSTQASSSTTTGALVVSGGLGVAGASYFGGALNVANSITASGIGGTVSASSGFSTTGSTSTGTLTTSGANGIRINAGAFNMAPDALSAGVFSISSAGTVTAGTWQGTAVGPVYGGTGQSTYATGDLLYASAANTLSKLTKPASTTSILQMTSAGVPSWVDPCTAVANCTLDGGTF